MQPHTTRDTKESQVLKYYERFEPLANKYAHNVYSAGKIGFEFEDLVQEFKIKIYLSVIAYAARWKKYRQSGLYKPIGIEHYVKSALANRCKDFIKEIKAANYNNVSIENDSFDYGTINTIEGHLIISPKVCKCEINGIDLLQGLTDMEARCFIQFIRGWTITKLQKVFGGKFKKLDLIQCRTETGAPVYKTASSIIRSQIQFLKTKETELLENKTFHFTSYKVDLDGN